MSATTLIALTLADRKLIGRAMGFLVSTASMDMGVKIDGGHLVYQDCKDLAERIGVSEEFEATITELDGHEPGPGQPTLNQEPAKETDA